MTFIALVCQYSGISQDILLWYSNTSVLHYISWAEERQCNPLVEI